MATRRRTASPRANRIRRRTPDHGPHFRLRLHLACAGHRRGDRPGQDPRAVLAAAVQGLRAQQAVDEGQQAGRDLPGLQRPRDRLQPGPDPDLRDRHRRRVQSGRRGLGPAPGAQGRRPPRAGLAHRAVGDPGRLRPDHRQPDGRRPRPDRAAEPDVRPARRLALPGDPLRGQRGAVPGAVGSALLQPGPRDPQGRRELRPGPERADLGHRRHEPPAAGRARRPDQPRVGQRSRAARWRMCRPSAHRKALRSDRSPAWRTASTMCRRATPPSATRFSRTRAEPRGSPSTAQDFSS
ncbi:MAG: hypothetical protein RJB37_210 [Pseudomonadota bacterium]